MKKFLPIVMNLMTRSVLKICNTTQSCLKPIFEILKFQFINYTAADVYVYMCIVLYNILETSIEDVLYIYIMLNSGI